MQLTDPNEASPHLSFPILRAPGCSCKETEKILPTFYSNPEVAHEKMLESKGIIFITASTCPLKISSMSFPDSIFHSPAPSPDPNTQTIDAIAFSFLNQYMFPLDLEILSNCKAITQIALLKLSFVDLYQKAAFQTLAAVMGRSRLCNLLTCSHPATCDAIDL